MLKSRAVATAQHRRVFGPLDWLLFVMCSVVNVGGVAWILLRLLRALDPVAHPVVLLAVVPLLMGLVGFEARWFSLPLMRVPEPMEPEPGLRVAAVTTFVPALEPIDMLRRTVASMVAMHYPHDTWVLDEGDDPEVERLCAELGARHFSRKGIERYQQPSGPFAARSKHGNYNAWFDAMGYEAYDVIAGFDPDHIPKPEFLDRTIGYLRDERIGYVQAAQIYYNQPAGLIARGAAEETYAYYSSVQMTTFALGYPIVTGCHNVHRTRALREVGGFAAHEADDLLLGILYRAAGWEGVYVPEVLAAGITPVDWPAYLSQQRRWARAVVDLKLRVFPRLWRKLPVVERVVGSIHGLYYLHGPGSALGVLVMALMLATGWHFPLPLGVAAGNAIALVAVLLLCELFRQRFLLDWRSEWGLHLRAGLLRFAKWPTVLLACVDGVAGVKHPYAVTAKVRTNADRQLARAHRIGVVTVVGGGVLGLLSGHRPSGAILVAAAIYVGMSLAVLVVERRSVPSPYDDELAARRVPWSVTTSSQT